ncbi:M23 family metallopeptidase [Pacificimonas sp. WHA3]|uniref:M23 family metallopeptidase n=1 Tax=Pacificimonas pallii TaxID=2827236 RepID=A0ABS6SIV6_9SPHN|nr:M23 family metallopeptidase [Pacificimonas pallii]MBV7257866.1 M23 family metallopeptidase [Pacificimonas pallii]
MSRIADSFPDREFYMRSEGRIRYLTISSRVQLGILAALVFAMLAWLTVSGIMLARQYQAHQTEIAISAKAAKIARTANAVQAYRGSVDDRADLLEGRQEALEGLARRYFGDLPAAETAAPVAAGDTARNAVPGLGRLIDMEARQLAFAATITGIARARSARAEAKIARLGLKPARLLGARTGQGGPFIPFGNEAGSAQDTAFLDMAAAMDRMERLESALMQVPSAAPAKQMSLTSKFGFRYDPITRAPAMHMGQDFGGRHGEPILAAAPGRVARATRLRGYGNIVVLDHGRGIRTRYAHLSRIDVKPGQRVARGARIGGMGSTGRSTGTHLHFEVRIDGKAVDPRPFLEAAPHVLEIQNLAAGDGRTRPDAG